RQRNTTHCAKVGQAGVQCGRQKSSRQLQATHRPCYQIYSHLGKGCGCAGPGPRHHDWMETYCGYGRRKDRKGPPHLWTGRRGRDHRNGHYHDGGRPRSSREHNSCTVLRSCRNDGGERNRPPDGNCTQFAARVGAYTSGRDDVVGFLVLDASQSLLGNTDCGRGHMKKSDLDRLRDTYKKAIEEWIRAIRAEESL